MLRPYLLIVKIHLIISLIRLMSQAQYRERTLLTYSGQMSEPWAIRFFWTLGNFELIHHIALGTR